MEGNNFCPFISDSCRSDCTFYHKISISLELGKTTNCELDAFISARDEDEITCVANELKKLIQSKKK